MWSVSQIWLNDASEVKGTNTWAVEDYSLPDSYQHVHDDDDDDEDDDDDDDDDDEEEEEEEEDEDEDDDDDDDDDTGGGGGGGDQCSLITRSTYWVTL